MSLAGQPVRERGSEKFARGLKTRLPVTRKALPEQLDYNPVMKRQSFIFCDLHLKSMLLSINATVTDTLQRRRWTEDFVRCSEQDCKVHFNRDHGYVNIVDERLLGREHQNWCPTHNEPRAIIGLHPIGTDPEGRRVWQCLHPECSVVRSIHGLVHRGDVVDGPGGRCMVFALERTWATVEMVGDKGNGMESLGHWQRLSVDDLKGISAAADYQGS
jgi:hypothetical protein